MSPRMFILTLGTLWLGQGFAGSIELQEVSDPHSRDLAVLGSADGVRFRKYDYEAPEDHCLHYYVEEHGAHRGTLTHDLGGLCELAGPIRLTVQWREANGEVTFNAHLWRRDSDQGGSVGSLKIPVDTRAFSLSRVPSPELEGDRKTLLVSGSYGLEQAATHFKVFAELRSNPNAVTGTE